MLEISDRAIKIPSRPSSFWYTPEFAQMGNDYCPIARPTEPVPELRQASGLTPMGTAGLRLERAQGHESKISSVRPQRLEQLRSHRDIPLTRSELLFLQRHAGNAAVCQLIAEQTSVTPASATSVQRGFFGSIWSGIKKAASAVGSAISGAARWVAERFGDAAEWLVNLFRDLPERLLRLGKTIAEGLIGTLTLIPDAIGALIHGGIAGFAKWVWEKAKGGAAWVGTLLSRVFDLIGGPEIVEFVLHMVSNASPLSGGERAAAQSVLGKNAIRWDEVRVDEGGVLGLVFKLNQGRAFTTFHTINMTPADRADMSIVVHELTHVDQYEHAGSVYIGQALGDQIAEGAHAYDYGGPSGLTTDRAAGKHYADYGRERQAQIAQDYYTDTTAGVSTAPYDPFIAELQKGDM